MNGKNIMQSSIRNLLILFTLLVSSIGFGRNLRVIIDHNTFYTPETGHYIQVYMQFLATSVHYQDVDGKKHGEIDVQLILSQNNLVAGFDKYRLKTAPLGDTLFEDFYSIRRFKVQPGDYQLEFTAIDSNKPEDTISFTRSFHIDDWSEELTFSDIALVESISKTKKPSEFTKNGMELIPRLSTYYPVESEKLIFYTELNNTHLLGDSARFAFRYFVADKVTNKVVNELIGIKRIKASSVIPLLYMFNIEELSSGEYYLGLELLDDEGIVIRDKKVYFDRFNPLIENALDDYEGVALDPYFQKQLSSDSLFYFLESLIPISSRIEHENILKVIKTRDTLVAQKYFQSYWKKTSPLNSTDAWLSYKKLVHIVEKDYGTSLFPGFRTDRGRIFLKYGPPNTLVNRPNDPNQYPYEIWQYYKLGAFSNKRFIFYNPTLVGNDYVILHSDMPGELFNSNWEFELNKRGSGARDSRSRTNDEGILEGGGRR
jgi:GWxTD domain-containing protein